MLNLQAQHGLTIDPYRSAAMLSLGGINSFVFLRQATARREFSARLAVQNKAFYSPETQNGRRMIIKGLLHEPSVTWCLSACVVNS